MAYDKWRKRLSGEKVPTFPQPDEDDIGFYRKPITEKGTNAKTGQPNGKTKIVGWEPVAYYMAEGMLCGRIGNRDMTGDEVIDLWTWVVAHPINEIEYRRVAEQGLDWSDAPAKFMDIPAANRDVSKDDNAPPDMAPEKAHAEAIDAAIGAALKTITTEAEAAQALGSKNRIAELRLSCDKAGRALYEPMHASYVAVRDPWQAPVKRATEAEKRLNTAILSFRESERLRIAKEQAEAEQRQRELDEANARAADRAIARGEPEPMPEVEEVVVPVAQAAITPTYGNRKLREDLKKFAVIHDQVAAFVRFQNDPDLMARLEKLCTEAIRAGENVPGCTTREGLL